MKIYIVFGLVLVLGALMLSSDASAIDYYNEPVWVVRDSGSIFGHRFHADTDTRWRVQAGGYMQWGDGFNPPYASFKPHLAEDGRVLYEMDSNSVLNAPVGIILNDRNGSAISLTSERGCLVIRDETAGPTHIIGTIGNCDE